MQMKRLKPPQTRCAVKRRSAAGLLRSKAEREAVLRGDKIERSGAPNSLPGRLTCTRPAGCLPGFALRSLRLSPLFFFYPLHLKSIHLFIFPPTEQHQLGSTGTGHSRSSLQQAYVCVRVWRCCEDASSCCLVVPPPPPTNLPHPAKGKSEDEASRRRAPPCTSSPHTGHISGLETVSEEREKKNVKKMSWSSWRERRGRSKPTDQ